jgi:hypothetical protein
LKNNKKTVARRANRTKKMGSVARKNVLASEVATVRYSQARLLTKAAGIEVPGADDISIVASTVQTDAEGRVKTTWTRRVRSQAARQEMFLQAVRNVSKELTRPGKLKVPKRLNKDLLAVYPLGDPHIGMYAWEAETGCAFDLEIAERIMKTAIDDLVARAPAAETALLVDLGDYFHADNTSNQTARSGHALDVDTRWGKVFEVGIRIMAYQIEALLTKHKKVRVIVEIGNHDDHTSVSLLSVMRALFHNEPRVSFDDSPSKFHYFKFGKTLIGVTHGDTVKMKDLPGVMATDRAKEWGETQHRFWLVGHVHHHKSEEFPGVWVEYFRTLAPRDAWHNNSGYRAGRDQQVWTVDREYGVIRREISDIGRIQGLIQAKAKKNNKR